MSSTFHKPIKVIFAAAMVVLGTGTFGQVTRADERPTIFSSPEKPTIQTSSQDALRCVPLRNVGIAETAKNYYSSCDQDRKPALVPDKEINEKATLPNP